MDHGATGINPVVASDGVCGRHRQRERKLIEAVFFSAGLLLNEGAWWSNAGDGAGFQWSVFDNDYAMMTTKTEYSLHRQNAS